jgi:hypothetical protein
VAVTCARRPAFANQPFEMGEGLRHGKPPLRRAQVWAEQSKRYVEGAALAARQRSLRLLEPQTVVLDQLS